MNNQKQTINNGNLNDLTVADDQQSQIKGGPTPLSKRDVILKTSVAEQNSVLGDLEPAGDVKGGGGHVKVFSGQDGPLIDNHNETVASDTDAEDEAQTAKLADLPVAEEQEEQVKGGADYTFWRARYGSTS